MLLFLLFLPAALQAFASTLLDFCSFDDCMLLPTGSYASMLKICLYSIWLYISCSRGLRTHQVFCVPTALPTWPLSDADGWWSIAVPDWRGALATSPTALDSPGLACTHQSPSARAGRCCRAASSSPTMDLFWGAAGCHCWFLFVSDTRYGCCAS